MASAFDHQTNSFTSVARNLDQRLCSAVQGIKSNHESILQLSKSVWILEDYIILAQQLQSHVLQQMHMSTTLISQFTQLSDGIHSLLQGCLTPQLLPPACIKQALTQVNGIL